MIMKRVILLTGLMVTMAGLASAQTTGSNSSNSPQGSAETSDNMKNIRKKGAKKSNKSLNQRKIYKWKDGQKATPTGHEATGTAGGYTSIRKDTAATVKDTARKNGE